jgi:hypothetical protein
VERFDAIQQLICRAQGFLFRIRARSFNDVVKRSPLGIFTQQPALAQKRESCVLQERVFLREQFAPSSAALLEDKFHISFLSK